ncbi:phospholipase A [Cellvibrio sp. ARAG 10.3]|uniref:phospholipase A n=1 Tax=Cellvibrio sp. ARAG 10.3 TaxID=3451358 RepID=UPI003F488F95
MANRLLLASGLLLSAVSTQAQTSATDITIPTPDLNACLRSSVTGAADDMSVEELKAACIILLEKKVLSQSDELETQTISEKPRNERRALNERMTIEALNRTNRFTLTPHRRNYIMLASYKDDPNNEPYIAADHQLQNLRHTEAEFQLSVKILLREGIFDDNGHLFLGYTNQAFWQVYNRDISAPFRDTNHQPELILSFTNDWEIFGFRNVLNEGVINHQSNGQSGELSRSWNRVMFNTVFERGNYVFAFTPWYRLPEDEEDYPGDPRGDDNPDIEKFMGNFELNSAYKRKQNIFNVMLRNNLRSENKGAVELGWSFPVSQRSQTIRGYVKYFNGYGQSLIDYNDHSQVVALGFIFTDLF